MKFLGGVGRGSRRIDYILAAIRIINCFYFWYSYSGASTGGKWTQLASSLAEGGKEFHPQGAKNSTLKGGRIPQMYGSHIIYKSFLAHGSHTSTIRCSHVSDIRSFVPHCTVHPYLDREGVIGLRPLTKSFLLFGPQTSVQNFIKIKQQIATVGARTDRQTDRQTYRQKDASYFIICPMLCDSNHATDNKCRYPRLRGSGSTVVNMTSNINGTVEILTPCRSETPKNITRSGQNNYVMGPFNPANFCINRSKMVCSPYSWNM